MGNYRFLALEGPKPEHVSQFFNLLLNHRVTQVVRLTPAMEGNESKCAPYWENKTALENGKSYLLVPQSTQGSGLPYRIPYFYVDIWLDHAPGLPDLLLDLTCALRDSVSNTQDPLIAVHCSSGVSRTGSLIAAYLLVQDIDRQVKQGIHPRKVRISIEKIVAQLSLQRPHAVGQPKQYETLYRMVDLYVDRLSEALKS